MTAPWMPPRKVWADRAAVRHQSTSAHASEVRMMRDDRTAARRRSTALEDWGEEAEAGRTLTPHYYCRLPPRSLQDCFFTTRIGIIRSLMLQTAADCHGGAGRMMAETQSLIRRLLDAPGIAQV